jgi:alkane 1-monooxygenase
MRFRAFKYLFPLLVYIGCYRAFTVTGWEIYIPLFFAWVLVPGLELFIRPDPSNLSREEEELERKDKKYDLLLYFIVFLQYASLFRFLYSMSNDELTWLEIAGRVWVMGLLCGVFGINAGHELGHRSTKFEQTMARMLLLTSQYMHFYVEHNRGHHKRVATPEDPSSARYGESVYAFYFRSILFSYFSAWEIAIKEMKKRHTGRFRFILNEMLWYTMIQLAFVAAIILFFGWFTAICYLVAAGIGILLLETVNYIEHYGLRRKQSGENSYERAMPAHSWNSNHVIGRLALFELSRHSDHHYMASRKYQVLRHHEESPQMPTGYPGMMILATIPPAWFYVMNKRIKAFSLKNNSPDKYRDSLEKEKEFDPQLN